MAGGRPVVRQVRLVEVGHRRRAALGVDEAVHGAPIEIGVGGVPVVVEVYRGEGRTMRGGDARGPPATAGTRIGLPRVPSLPG